MLTIRTIAMFILLIVAIRNYEGGVSSGVTIFIPSDVLIH